VLTEDFVVLAIKIKRFFAQKIKFKFRYFNWFAKKYLFFCEILMETLFIGRNCIRLSETESTNTYAINLLKEVNVPDGTLIITKHQTNGRGQRGTKWLAEPGENITCSLVIHPKFLSLNEHFLISKIIALSIQKTIQNFLVTDKSEVKIKWPNDIMVKELKISGILIENSVQDYRIKNSVIGFGINVNQSSFGELNNIATSIFCLNKTISNCDEIINLICSYFESYYLKLKQKKYNSINEEYLNNLLHFNDLFQYQENDTGNLLLGKITNVENNGWVNIETLPDLEIKKYSLKEITFLNTLIT
jgi:BirA family biotin operon repressor/biotin-[acetyl-CoA-carboxylase] ligase